MSSSIQEQIGRILEERKSRLAKVDRQKSFWDSMAVEFDKFVPVIQNAEAKNPDSLTGLAAKVRKASSSVSEMASLFRHIAERFSRGDICIGIGGAGRMGKSTFLQAVTGLGEAQIPTSDMFYTTAGRSLIVNAQQAVAIADMHTKASFLEKVIAPMCRTINIPAPVSIEEFKEMDFAQSKADLQADVDVIKRLEDTRCKMSSIERELTGEKERRIKIEDLRDFVAYPADGRSKAGKFMAVENIVIYAPFPASEVKQLRVVDLPGLGEAGRDLAEVQTSGMSEVCDITLLMKRPNDKNVEWNKDDTNALDAMKVAAPLLDDQAKFTAILANVNGEPQSRAEACVASIEKQLSGRHFQIIRCNAKDRDAVLHETMPEVLSFLAKNLPVIDNAIFEKAEKESIQTKSGLQGTLSEVKAALAQLTRNSSGSPLAFQEDMYDKIVKSLSTYADRLRKTAEGRDEDWNNEVLRVTEKVKAWIDNGCGYGSMEKLTQAVADEILATKAQPTKTINHLRIAFREQWERMDEHLQSRIANVLDGFIQAIQKCTNSFVPARGDDPDQLIAIRSQLKETAVKLLKTPDQDPGDDIALKGLAMPLQRLAEFDLRFRFHLEPTLIAATEVLVSNKLQLVNDQSEADSFTKSMTKMLTEKADEYSKTMSETRSGNASIEKKKKLIEGAVKDPSVRKELIALLQGSVATTQSFCPNRIFAAVIENAVDAFLRFKDHDRAFAVWVRGYESELREEPSPAVRTALTAYAECSGLLKKLQ